jgi:hypothetical protein
MKTDIDREREIKGVSHVMMEVVLEGELIAHVLEHLHEQEGDLVVVRQ